MPEPYYQDDQVTLHHGDCVDVLADLADVSIDAVVTDPPYGLDFMGKHWDTGAVAFDTAVWGHALRVLKPGGHLLAFGGSRTWHRLAVAIEDAGFEIRDSIAWLYGSGFPKSRDVTGAMTHYLAGDRPELAAALVNPDLYVVTRFLRDARDAAGWTNRRIDELFGTNGMAGHWTSQASQPACPSARQWAVLKERMGFGGELDALVERIAATERPEGYGASADGGAFLDTLRKNVEYSSAGGWGTALKPAFEPVVVGRKRIKSTVAQNIYAHGTGALNIDGCRVQYEQVDIEARKARTGTHAGEAYGHNGSVRYSGGEVAPVNPAGRWPTNVVIDEHAAGGIDQQSGVSVSRRAELTSTPGGIYGDGKGLPSHTGIYGHDDEGGASRFFPTFRYNAKAPGTERPSADGIAHPTVKPLDLMRWLVRLVTPPHGLVLDPFAGSGTTAEACIHEHMRCITIEREADYLPVIVARLSKPMAVGFDFEEEPA